MNYYELDKEEKEIIEAIDKGTLESVPNVKKEIFKLQEVARNTLNKVKSINIRVSEKDLQKIKSKAVEQGIPYQTLITSVIHQYGSK